MKLLTIGDSISQGFMSGAAARTDMAYSTILSKVLNEPNYNYPTWGEGGHPLNIEEFFRILELEFGSNISGAFEWPSAIFLIQKYLDKVEDYYERGKGSEKYPPSKFTSHNLSIRGYDMADSWLITPDLCRRHIASSINKRDNLFGIVDQSFLRTALTVLEAGSETGIKNSSQLDWLEYHHNNEGVENLILWLGANNALGAVLSLKINQTSIDGTAFEKGADSISYEERVANNWNLWHPTDFKVEYEFMLNKVLGIMETNKNNTDYKVFIATVPLVTILPLIKAVGGRQDRETVQVMEWRVDPSNPAPIGLADVQSPINKRYSYGKYYPYFPFAEDFDISLPHLNIGQALHIDNTIREYNRIIIESVATANEKIGRKRFFLVDISSVLSDMAIKRNNFNPPYKYPSFFDFAYPRIDTKFYGTTRSGQIMAGGLFRLDGVHPTAIGQGLIAYEFLKVMKNAGTYTGEVEKAIDWNAVFRSDTMYCNPISLISEIYDNIEMKKWIIKLLTNRNKY